MKKSKLLFGIIIVVGVLFFVSCEDEKINPPSQDETIIPERFKVDIPSSLSTDAYNPSTLKSASADTLKGDGVYENLKNFIAIGEGAADIAQAIVWHIKAYNIQGVTDVTYTSDEDYRTKHLVVKTGTTFDSRIWEYQLTITDNELEGNADGGVGMQVFWNNNPIEGIAIIKPFNLNKEDDENLGETMYSVEYSEKGMDDYDAYMIVQISDFPLPASDVDPYGMNSLKMFVGKKGDIVDVYGNSNHPNAKFFTSATGFNWAFVASADKNDNIAVAEVGLPPSTLDETSRTILLEEYSIKNVLTDQINIWFMDKHGVLPNSADLATYLMNTDAPGYFDNQGFIQGGTMPNDKYEVIKGRINDLTPYNPKSISELAIEFVH